MLQQYYWMQQHIFRRSAFFLCDFHFPHLFHIIIHFFLSFSLFVVDAHSLNLSLKKERRKIVGACCSLVLLVVEHWIDKGIAMNIMVWFPFNRHQFKCIVKREPNRQGKIGRWPQNVTICVLVHQTTVYFRNILTLSWIVVHNKWNDNACQLNQFVSWITIKHLSWAKKFYSKYVWVFSSFLIRIGFLFHFTALSFASKCSTIQQYNTRLYFQEWHSMSQGEYSHLK